MSIIQTIRDKYARWAVIGIALAIIGFLLMDASVGRSRLFSGGEKNTVGVINGQKIDREDFSLKLASVEKNMEQQQQGMPPEAKRGRALESLWEQEVSTIILETEMKKLGLSITENERADMISGTRPSEVAQQYFSQQGQPYDGIQILQSINQVRRGSNNDQKTFVKEVFKIMDIQRLQEKYNSLFFNSVNVPKWFIETQNADNSRIAKISFVKVNYTDSLFGADSSIKISDEEIMEVVNKHKKQYKQTESRSISYVSFSASPNAADSADAKNKVSSLSQGFKEAADTKQFLDREGSEFPFFNGYVSATSMSQPAKDSVIKLAPGEIYGPYLDNSHYVTAKMLDIKSLPDSVICRHILFRTGTEPGALTDSIAEIRIDSAIQAINKGADFVSLMKQVSMDQGATGLDQGLMRFSAQQIQDTTSFDQDFGRFILYEGKKGQRKKVKTKFGYHYIEITDQKNIAPQYKIAYLSKPIETSNETETDASNRANAFAGKSRDLKSFDANYEKELKPLNINKGIAANITPGGYEVSGLGESRPFVKKIYEAKKGDVIQPEKVGSNYVVAVVTEILKEGTQSAATVRSMTGIERDLRNKKKAEIIKKKLGTITTVEAAATALNKTVENVDSVGYNTGAKISYDLKVLGACFNAANKGKVVPDIIAGSSGVYVLFVQSTGTAPVPDANVAEKRKLLIDAAKRLAAPVQQYQFQPAPTPPHLQALRDAAKIKDNRPDIY